MLSVNKRKQFSVITHNEIPFHIDHSNLVSIVLHLYTNALTPTCSSQRLSWYMTIPVHVCAYVAL